MTKLTLPIEIGRRYVRRDGKVVTATDDAAITVAGACVTATDEAPTPLSDFVVFKKTGCVDIRHPGKHPHDLIADAPGHEQYNYAITDYAHVLRAIADGREVQCRIDDEWKPASASKALEWINERLYRPAELRIKPDTITINGREVPAPVREAPGEDQEYWLASLASSVLAVRHRWNSSATDSCWLSRGLIHLTEEAARQHAEALLSFTRSGG